MIPILFSLLVAAHSAGDEGRSLSGSVPVGAFAFAETDGLAEVIRGAQQSELYQSIVASDGMREFLASEESKEMRNGIKWAETILRMDLWEAAEKLFGGRAAVALYPAERHAGKLSDDDPESLFVIEPADAKAWSKQRIWTDPLLAIGARRIARGEFQVGTKVYETKPEDPGAAKTYFALHRERVMMSSSLALLRRGLELHEPEPEGEPLAGSDHLAELARRHPGQHLARAFVDTGLISAAAGGRLGLPEKMDNPIGSLIFGGMLEIAAHSELACLAVDLEGDEFAARVTLDADPAGLPPRYQVFFAGGSQTRTIPQVPGLIGGVTMHRDLATWYRSRDDLLQQQVLPGFDKFETGLGNILPGKDIGEDVIPLIGKNFTFVSAVQDFDYLDGEPGVQLPGFAVIFDLAGPDPQAGADMFQLFFQTFLSILNLQAAEQERQPWLIAAQDHGGAQITYARYFEKPKGEQLPVVFNFLPAAARVGDQFVVSSSLGMCKDVVDCLKGAGQVKREHNSRMLVDFDRLAEVLQANRQHLVASRLNEGRDTEQAIEDIDHLFLALKHLGPLRAAGEAGEDGFAFTIKGAFK